jgi:hypothetical protein
MSSTDTIKLDAQAAVIRAVREGVLARGETCEECGAYPAPRNPLHAHHHRGYSKDHWLHVVWLCASCHYRAHLTYTVIPTAAALTALVPTGLRIPRGLDDLLRSEAKRAGVKRNDLIIQILTSHLVVESEEAS